VFARTSQGAACPRSAIRRLGRRARIVDPGGRDSELLVSDGRGVEAEAPRPDDRLHRPIPADKADGV
jgi:hypothetical protein